MTPMIKKTWVRLRGLRQPEESTAEGLARRARDRNWHEAPPHQALLTVVAENIDRIALRRPPKILVVGDEDVRAWVRLLRAQWPEARVLRVEPGADRSQTHVRLSVRGPLDFIIDPSTGSAAAQAETFQRVFMHLRRRGVYIARRIVPGDEAPGDDAEDPTDPPPRIDPGLGSDLWDLVSAAQAARLRDFRDHRGLGVLFRDVVGLGTMLERVEVHSKVLVVVAGARVSPKIHESEGNQVLAALPRLGEVLHTLPAVSWTPDVGYTSNLDDDRHIPRTSDVPELSLRRYDNPTCARGQVVTSRNLLLPETFRHHSMARMVNVYVQEKAPLFGSVRREIRDPEPLPGAYFHFDCEWPGHFGHLLTDQVSRLWAWERVKQAEPDVKLLTALPPDRDPAVLAPFEAQILGAFGVQPEDVVVFDQPCAPERLYAATSMFSLPLAVHPDVTAVWDRIGDHLMSAAPERERPTRLFVSRRLSLKRACSNTEELEDLFRRRGFEVFYPEEHPLAEQVAMFRSAEVVAGFAGSGLFTLALTRTPKRVLTIAPSSYTARNEYFIAAVRHHRLTSLWSRPDVAHPVGGWTMEAFSSSFTFDLENEGRVLEDWFATV
jgi:capsular polysaccharide biosynthesis protein